MILPVWQAPAPRLILASGSAARRAVLEQAGLAFETVPSDVDESVIKQQAREARLDAGAASLRLARAKAGAVSALYPEAWVIGGDQILSSDETWFDKPGTMEVARTQLRRLRGRTHELHTALVLTRGGVEQWSHLACPRLVMRDFSEAFLDAYLVAEGPSLLGCVGACRVEGPGIMLFDRIEGEHAAILGVPLLALLAHLRAIGLLRA